MDSVGKSRTPADIIRYHRTAGTNPGRFSCNGSYLMTYDERKGVMWWFVFVSGRSLQSFRRILLSCTANWLRFKVFRHDELGNSNGFQHLWNCSPPHIHSCYRKAPLRSDLQRQGFQPRAQRSARKVRPLHTPCISVWFTVPQRPARKASLIEGVGGVGLPTWNISKSRPSNFEGTNFSRSWSVCLSLYLFYCSIYLSFSLSFFLSFCSVLFFSFLFC